MRPGAAATQPMVLPAVLGTDFPQHETERRVREIIKRLPERKPG